MSETKFQITPGENQAATFEMTKDGQTLTTELSRTELQGMVDLLAAVRMVMPGSVPNEPPQGETQAIVDPPWVSPSFRIPKGRVIILKHPGLGWLHFVFGEEEAANLSQTLVTPFDAPPQDTVN